MANIVLSDKAPDDETLRFSLGQADGLKAPFESDDPVIIGAALVHPWLDVEVDERVDDVESVKVFGPEDDGFSAVNSKANDPELVAAERERRAAEEGTATHTAIQAGLDQGDVHFVGFDDNTATTLAAVEDRGEVDDIAPDDSAAVQADPVPADFDPDEQAPEDDGPLVTDDEEETN